MRKRQSDAGDHAVTSVHRGAWVPAVALDQPPEDVYREALWRVTLAHDALLQ